MRTATLNALKDGINRLRVKGGPSPGVLYDLLNGYVAPDGSVRSRPGMPRVATLPAATFGLCAFKAKLYTFAALPVAAPPAGYVVKVLRHPTDAAQALVAVAFAVPFMGAIYAVARFADGKIVHYWTPAGTAVWAAGASWTPKDVFMPAVDNGLAFRIVNVSFPQPWAAKTKYVQNGLVAPEDVERFQYRAVAVYGDGVSGEVTPEFPTVAGAQVFDGDTLAVPTDTAPPTRPAPRPDPGDRYTNPGGPHPGPNPRPVLP